MATTTSQGRGWVPSLFLLICSLLLSPGSALPYKAVNLGGWLVAEDWITPYLFSDMGEDELLDGAQVQFMSATLRRYLTAEDGGGGAIVANRPDPSGWETFTLWRVDSTRFQFRVFKKQFVGMADQAGAGGVVARALTPDSWETFEIVRRDGDGGRVRIRASNGRFLQARSETSVTVDGDGSGSWGDDDPSVFLMTRLKGGLRGEYQLVNFLGPERANTRMKSHWEGFVVESDFQFIKDSGLEAVRIPVGWWIAKPSPPFVDGSVVALEKAFSWAEKYGLKVIVDLHAAPGSQNGFDHSGSRDGSIEWGTTEYSIQKTVDVIDFLARSYAGRESLAAIELLNEPLTNVSFETLRQYYQAGYDAVRRYTSSAYVVMSARVSTDGGEFLDFAGGLQGSVLDVHYYNLYTNDFRSMTAQQHIDYVRNNRARELSGITNRNGGPLTFVGEWAASWDVQGATAEELREFARAQVEVYGGATFGWGYWTLKGPDNTWSLKWMINNGYISLK